MVLLFVSSVLGGILYTAARREGYNVLALAQHLDDLAESFVMSAFHNGRLTTMKAHYMNKVRTCGDDTKFFWHSEKQTVRFFWQRPG